MINTDLKNCKNNKITIKGFSIIELLIYISLISIFVTSAIIFSWDIIYGREKIHKQQLVEQNARIALAKISYEIKRAKNINNISNNTIVLDNGSSTTTISLNAGILKITSGATGPYNLISNEVVVLEPPQALHPLFKDLRTTDNNSKSIGVNITLKSAQPEAGSQTYVRTNVSDSVELNSQFNQARSLIMNASSVFLNNGYKELNGATLENSGPNNITVDKIIVSWTGGGQGVNVTEIKINNTIIYGSPLPPLGSGSIFDINPNTTIPTGINSIPVDYFKFSGDISNTVITISFIMTDGSISKTTIDFT